MLALAGTRRELEDTCSSVTRNARDPILATFARAFHARVDEIAMVVAAASTWMSRESTSAGRMTCRGEKDREQPAIADRLVT